MVGLATVQGVSFLPSHPLVNISIRQGVPFWNQKKLLLCSVLFGFVSQAWLEQRWALPFLAAPSHNVRSVE